MGSACHILSCSCFFSAPPHLNARAHVHAPAHAPSLHARPTPATLDTWFTCLTFPPFPTFRGPHVCDHSPLLLHRTHHCCRLTQLCPSVPSSMPDSGKEHRPRLSPVQCPGCHRHPRAVPLSLFFILSVVVIKIKYNFLDTLSAGCLSWYSWSCSLCTRPCE